MLDTPNCYSRKCIRFFGVRQDGMSEVTERVVCKAFPEGIPSEIAYGDNPHTEPYPGDHGIQFERGTNE